MRVLGLITAFVGGCRDAPLAQNVISNITPIAHAGDTQAVAFDGAPVRVTLDASESSDADGRVVDYRWYSGNAGDGGVGRGGPDPDDTERPTIDLDEGVWVFTLFVIDDAGGVSLPTTVTIMVGDAVPPEVAECVAAALDTIADDCRTCVCGQSDMCRTAIAACDQGCWDLYTCVENQCGELSADQEAQANCVRSSCAELLGSAAAYQPLVPCVSQDPCVETCAAGVRE
ncbi:MAG: hypothetical protein ABW321_23620 [Polyangiales bacterium]